MGKRPRPKAAFALTIRFERSMLHHLSKRLANTRTHVYNCPHRRGCV